jgi:hypothetical protein
MENEIEKLKKALDLLIGIVEKQSKELSELRLKVNKHDRLIDKSLK